MALRKTLTFIVHTQTKYIVMVKLYQVKWKLTLQKKITHMQ